MALPLAASGVLVLYSIVVHEREREKCVCVHQRASQQQGKTQERREEKCTSSEMVGTQVKFKGETTTAAAAA